VALGNAAFSVLEQEPMGQLRATIAATARHLCIDMQVLFSRTGPWPTPWMERVLPTVAELVAFAPERTVFTRFITPRSAEDMPGMWQAYYRKWPQATQQELSEGMLELMPELRRFAPPARVHDKHVYSAFADGTLIELLREARTDTLIFTGSETDVCVLSSVLAAVDHGYRVILARDGVCSSSDESHDALLGFYERRFDIQIELGDTAEILDGWQRP
jgi:nicotinamidase-related amidase